MTKNGNILQLSAFTVQNKFGRIEDKSLVPAIFSSGVSFSKSLSALHPLTWPNELSQ